MWLFMTQHQTIQHAFYKEQVNRIISMVPKVLMFHISNNACLVCIRPTINQNIITARNFRVKYCGISSQQAIAVFQGHLPVKIYRICTLIAQLTNNG